MLPTRVPAIQFSPSLQQNLWPSFCPLARLAMRQTKIAMNHFFIAMTLTSWSSCLKPLSMLKWHTAVFWNEPRPMSRSVSHMNKKEFCFGLQTICRDFKNLFAQHWSKPTAPIALPFMKLYTNPGPVLPRQKAFPKGAFFVQTTIACHRVGIDNGIDIDSANPTNTLIAR